MSLTPEVWAELDDLMGAVRDGSLTPEKAVRLEELIVNEPEARAYYLEYTAICATLRHYQGKMDRRWDDPDPQTRTPRSEPPAADPAVAIRIRGKGRELLGRIAERLDGSGSGSGSELPPPRSCS